MSDSTFDSNTGMPPVNDPGQPGDQHIPEQPDAHQGSHHVEPGQQTPGQQDYRQAPEQTPYQQPYQQYPDQPTYQHPYQQVPGQPGDQHVPGQPGYQHPYQQAPHQSPQSYHPYQQDPGQQGYQQAPGQQTYQPYQPTPGHQGYQQIPDQQGYQHPYQHPYQPYAPMPAPPYQQPAQPAKRKVWPWVLAGCLIFALLSLGGCVSCVACSVLSYENGSSSSRYPNTYDYGYNYDYDDLYDYFNDNGADDSNNLNSYTFTKEDLEKMKADEKGSVEDGICSTGMYEVGAGKDIEPGLYFLSGSQTEEGAFTVFSKGNGTSSDYTIAASVVYYGNYYAELEEGSYILFGDPDGATMCLAEKSDFKPEGPTYQSGCYRVGVDIPAGTYKASYVSDAKLSDTQESGVYVMKDLDWTKESIVESYNLIAGSGPTITVEEGQYVELYAASMSPVSA